jgi:hypothetical protein
MVPPYPENMILPPLALVKMGTNTTVKSAMVSGMLSVVMDVPRSTMQHVFPKVALHVLLWTMMKTPGFVLLAGKTICPKSLQWRLLTGITKALQENVEP